MDFPKNNEKENFLAFPRFDFSFNNKKLYNAFGVVVFILIINFSFILPPNDFPVNTIINIKEGSSLRTVSKNFKELKIIKSRLAFETMVISLGGERVVSGDYLLDKKLSAFSISRRVSNGYKNLAPVRVTIPEGFNNNEIAEAFSSKLIRFNSDNFFENTKTLEGYLFPDTYFFLTTDTEIEVVEAMNNNFNKQLESLQGDIAKSGKSLKDIIIMASLIEEESHGDTDREMISGILWKRLKIGMALQVDADPSTYKQRGLPKYPISNPGILSIKAAIYPKTSNYLYYLHDKEGDIHYGVNYYEHLKNIRIYLKP